MNSIHAICAGFLLLSACATPPDLDAHPAQSTQSASPRASAPDQDTQQIAWQRSLADALALAQAENRPLLLAVNMDGESASDRIVNEQYRDPAFVAATRECVCLVASVFRHAPRDHDDEGRRIPCPRLGVVTCGEHMALEPLLFEELLADGERVAPRHALVLPSGEKAWDLSLCFDLHDIDRALIASVGTGVPRSASFERTPNSDESWSALAARRDHRGRARLEAKLASVENEEALCAALDALAASGHEASGYSASGHAALNEADSKDARPGDTSSGDVGSSEAESASGNAGASDALRIVGARLPRLSVETRAKFVATVRALDLAPELALALREQLASPGADPREPASSELSVLLPVLAELDGDSPTTRSFLLACRALSGYGGESARAVQLAFGSESAASIEAALTANGGALSSSELLQSARHVTASAAESELPASGLVGDAMPEAEALQLELESLDDQLRSRGDDAELRAHFAKASLDLARRRIESRAGGVPLLLEDAERNFALALASDPTRVEWWIESARTAYFQQDFAQQVEFGRHARALIGEVDDDSLLIEAERWIGDGHARLLAERSGADPAVELAGILEGLRALGAVAASRYADTTDWASFASFLGALGLRREELAVALCGAERLPAANELRQVVNTALWSTGRIELAPSLAESIALRNESSAGALWHAGYAWILAAEDHRRREACDTAIGDYDRARAHFFGTAKRAPEWAANCNYYAALTWLGTGLAHVRLGHRALAADCLVAAAVTHADLAQARDGLGYDVLDLVDKIFEWRDSGPSTVDPLRLLDRLEIVASGTPYWATAISDSQLREALRADGRNPERAERDSVDAEGRPVRQVMGLPWAEGDPYLEASITAGRRALANATTEEDRKPLVQSLTIRAERQLELGRLEGVQAALAEAAPLLGFEPPAPDADEASLRDLAQRLRKVLGEARPRWRDGR